METREFIRMIVAYVAPCAGGLLIGGDLGLGLMLMFYGIIWVMLTKD